MGTTPPTVLLAWALAGLVLGWLLHPLSDLLLGAPLAVTWLAPVALWVMAAVLGYAAWVTWRQVRDRQLLFPHHAVNRLLLARASALVGALVGAGYLGYALSWVGSAAPAAAQWQVRSLVAAAAGAAIVVASLLLERSCRVRVEDDSTGAA